MEKHPLRSTALRRWYFACLAGTILVLGLLRFLIFPAENETVSWRLTSGAVLDTLIAATLASILIGVAYVWLFDETSDASMEVIEAREIGNQIKAQARHARKWDVRARTANYFTSVTLPLLTDAALESGRACRIRIQMLDPENDRLMDAYALFRSNHPGQAAQWTAERVRCEIYASILRTAIYKERAPRLEIQIGLSPAFWVMSLDLCDSAALLTGQDKGNPALLIRNDSSFYDGWHDDFDAGFAECRILHPNRLNISEEDLKGSPTPETATTLKSFFGQLQLDKYEHVETASLLLHLGRDNHYA